MVERLNVRDWINLASVLVGATITILVLVWINMPSSGFLTTTALLLFAFVSFMNSITANSKAKYDNEKDVDRSDRIKKLIKHAEHSFGLGYTFVIVSMNILTYKYMMDATNNHISSLVLAILFMIIVFLYMHRYNSINRKEKDKVPIKARFKRSIWIIIENIAIICIIADFMGYILIP